MRFKTYLLIVAVGLLAFVLTGCGGSSSKEDPNEMVLRHAMYTKIISLDPGNIRDIYSMIVAGQICEPLYQYHFLKRPYEIVPLIAEEMPQISDDKLTYTIKLKKGVRFQDDACFEDGKGRELKAQDFIYSIKRIANIKYISPNWSIFDDKIVGLDDFREYTKTCKSIEEVDFSRDVEGLQAPDDHTLVVKLKRPWPQFTATALADIATAPVAAEAVDHYEKDIVSRPVGTGPYMLKTWNRGSYIELVRNPSFRGELYPSEGGPGDAEAGYLDDTGKMMPFADRVTWRVIEEYQPAWLLFLQGKLDGSVIPKDNYSEALTENRELTAKMKGLGIHLKSFIDPSTFWVGFNMQDPVLGKNKPLRQAINRAIDRQKFIDLFFNGRHLVAHGFVAPLMDSYDPSIKERGYAKHDLQEAKSLLKKAEEIHGGAIPELELSIPGTDTFGRQMGQFLRQQIQAIGLTVEVEFMDWPTYRDKVKKRKAQMFTAGAGASITDAEDFLHMFYSKHWAPGSNDFLYKNPDYDAMYEKVRVMFDSQERKELYRKMEIMVLEDCPAAFLNHRMAYILHHDWYKNYKPHAFAHNMSKYRRIELEKRAGYKNLYKKVK